MSESKIAQIKLSRVYGDEKNGDDQDRRIVLIIDRCLMSIHLGLEFMYFLLGCWPMMIINVLSILTYFYCQFVIKKGRSHDGIRIMMWEVYFHVLCVVWFMGGGSGFQQWLFGVLCAAFFPYVSPKIQTKHIVSELLFGLLISASYIIITVAGWKMALPAAFAPPTDTQIVFFCANSIIAFSSIMIILKLHSSRMWSKNDELKHMADYDSLTGMYNRLRVQKLLDNEVKNQEGKTFPLCIAIMDIDFFKKVNDTYGHNAGDFVLRELASIMMPSREQGLIIGRWGGEEFLLIAPDGYPYPAFCVTLNALCKMVEEHEFNYNGTVIPLTVSIGACEYAEEMSTEKIIQEADARLYEAKESGRNRVICE